MKGLRCIHLEFNAWLLSMAHVSSGMAFHFGLFLDTSARCVELLSDPQHKWFPCLSLFGSQGDRCVVLLWDGVFRMGFLGLTGVLGSTKK